MSPLRPLLLAAAFLCAPAATGADRKDVDAAIEKGTEFLKKGGGANAKQGHDPDHVGATALVGLALLETGTPPNDPVVRKVTERLRDASFSQTQTYQIALCILYFDRLGDPGDRAIIQMLGVRLLAGQNPGGGWTYACVPAVPPATEKLLRARLGEAALVAGKGPAVPKPGVPPAADAPKPGAAGRLHADVERYRQGLLSTSGKNHKDDNSNSQFGVLGVWVARKHGVPVERALELIERRYLAQQGASGGWPYPGPGAGPDGTPSMTCAGLIGLATAVGRREERTLRAEAPKPPAKKPDDARPAPPPGTDPNDPFYNPPKPKPPATDPAPAKRPADAPKPTPLDAAIARGMDHLAAALAGQVGKGKRGNVQDLYFLWSMERVAVIYGVDKIGDVDWYARASDLLVRTQNANGSWGGRGGYGPDVDTSFALLVLARSNLARDLSAKVQKNLGNTELRAGAGGPLVAPDPGPAKPADPVPGPGADPLPKRPEPPKPAPGTTAAEIAAELFRATGASWADSLKRVRDAKGAENTSGLLAVIPLLDGERRAQARAALCERLTRMNAATLRGMLKAGDAELRRAAALACAMKDDKDHVADLILVLDDKDADVAKAARAGLKSLTGKDFATAAEWRAWFAKQ